MNMFVQPRPIVHDQQVTVHHWQLRDLLLTDKQFRNEVIVPVGHDIIKYNYVTGKKEFLLEDIGYNSTCMAAGFGYLATGGQHGDLTLKDIKGDFERYFESQNFTSVSPDGEKMVAVGDDNSVLLFNISYSGRYELAQTMNVSKDANFSVAWNHTSEKFAVSSQDGSVHVWDIRHSNPVAKFKGINPSVTKGAARCVKFTQSGGVDLLAFTEHASHVHIVDARTFDEQQTLKIASTIYDAPLTGLCFSSDSSRMFVGKCFLYNTQNLI
ncbi:hypothetical protein CU098_006625 [Rhizopus stolonifer]|uniref:DUF2415 domain-containing protein n=1 Tax=Rhizopus stolonifer TaxID=4846 RepID=A0A367J396_RHIST|nr:hypothetical protein CU098_006625 [Rhizopus stolonifer]